MSFFSKLFRKENPSLCKVNGEPKTSGELITELTDGANLVDGRQTWELADEKKYDIEYMMKCCDAELKTMEVAGLIAAPYYFERVAVLSRKAKNYHQELHYCETYIRLVENYYAMHGTEGIADVRKGPRFQAIVARLPKARELLVKSEQVT
ncbi:MAG: hypothetical protein OEL57_11770 [Trichlorobacter sp.]|uniref:hypothetical protein n=1 Tax=Trichlorobacter sp. TaxID=2911007 RepID=UPI002567FC7D|nr:hypothetical protein [Trichlorobacter sp.]MDK9718565.1 hypothetical protein [Trichlorobacter sp.]